MTAPRKDERSMDHFLEFIAYDPLTGIFTWKKKPRKSRVQVGDVAGSLNGMRYWQVCLHRHVVHGHRLAWFITTGALPTQLIDHRNGIRHDNRLSNLRDASRTVNAENVYAPRKDNKLGIRGVWFCKRRKNNPFLAEIVVDGKKQVVGGYPTAELAGAAYMAAKLALQPGAIAAHITGAA